MNDSIIILDILLKIVLFTTSLILLFVVTSKLSSLIIGCFAISTLLSLISIVSPEFIHTYWNYIGIFVKDIGISMSLILLMYNLYQNSNHTVYDNHDYNTLYEINPHQSHHH
jgi:hypothetical protein